MTKLSLAERYIAGATYKQIADEEGLSISSVRAVILDSGVTPRPRGAPRQARPKDRVREAQIIARYTAGETLQQIADDIGVSRQRVCQIMDKAGVSRRHPVRREKPVGFKEPKGRYVYFARAGNGLVKIGCSDQPERRLTQIGEWVPYKIELAATIAGTYDLEAALHRMFATSWSHLEWFHSTPQLNRLIDDVSNGRPFAILPAQGEATREAVIRAKKRLTRRIHAAEAARWKSNYYGELRQHRPAAIFDLMARYQGPHNSDPSEEDVAEAERYIASLRIEGLAA